jgi:hypothetical protein
MKNAFAKLLQMNPVQNSTVEFRAGGNNVPILTRASGSSTAGFQTMGLPDGSRPMPGGGANRTVLGAARMGDQDGNANASAGFNSFDIFTVPGQPDREYPERTFANVGNNVFQPENNDSATLALLRRLGDQQFKATSQAPFEDYRAQQRLAQDLDEASRNASLSDLGTSREIIRNLAAERRQQNEDDYLRKMLDSGATPEAAKKEIEDVRNANAIQEAKKVDDRQYQAKTLIQRMAMARGITPMVQEPLNQSSSIDNPQRSQAMSQAMGMPGEGFGTSPLDMNRQFLTPDFYKKFLRKTALTQESADQESAFNNLLATGQVPLPDSGAYSLATMRGQERQLQVENAAEGVASRLETIRARGTRIKLPLPENIIGKDVLDVLYNEKTKKPGNPVLVSLESIQEMRPLQLLIALNFVVVRLKFGVTNLFTQLQAYTLGTKENPSPTFLNDVKEIVILLNGNEQNVRIPFASATSPSLSVGRFVTILQDIKSNNSGNLALEHKRAHDQFLAIMAELIEPEMLKQSRVREAAEREQMSAADAESNAYRQSSLKALRQAFFSRRTANKLVQPDTPGAPGAAPTVPLAASASATGGAAAGGAGSASGGAARTQRPPKNAPADEWSAWAVLNNLPLPHTKKSLVLRYAN